ncbi:hypothetical protein C900_02937 [Fulvivirga imtechensis AK7]|uniref:Sulfatase-modifying factor enzyme-like domain-containing protein n=1 Tax=Fulvivirga imtechensis AK7 TaxID=1237149 RepID=L8JVR9_9BACT|nr:SUMF1/EgtB/PvdO family nonheme iron enzyme [Fulvivirga imtechensis]ELR71322.1 hypothetical protein C900_02937 [Fulvivirga imtechensis AK7]
MKNFFLTMLLLLACLLAQANNITVSNVSLTGQNTVSGYTLIQFDLSWENSWRLSTGPANWDAAWVFIKFRVGGGDWQHGSINYADGTAANDGHTEPVGCTISTPSDRVGTFIYRNTDGSGTANFTGIQLRWNYGDNGVADDDMVDVKVFAIEMVYVPQGSFYLGGAAGGTETNRFYGSGDPDQPYLVSGIGSITVGTGAGQLYYDDNGSGGDQTGPISLFFPKGYNAFYCMKYEVSQEQWIAYFNTLTSAQKQNFDITGASRKNSDSEVNGNGIAWTSGNATTTRADYPVNYVNFQYLHSYLDWAGLRPMTELEYEKACRGPLYPVIGEYAWGTSNLHATDYTIQNEGSSSSVITDMGELIGNAWYQSTSANGSGPTRCGIFAASSVNHTREETGGSYYGIMELTGNLFEFVVSIGSSGGRGFQGLHGNGVLAADGSGNISGLNEAAGNYGIRGGSFPYGVSGFSVAGRPFAITIGATTQSTFGIRGVRSGN